jgi:hypothetical protein
MTDQHPSHFESNAAGIHALHIQQVTLSPGSSAALSSLRLRLNREKEKPIVPSVLLLDRETVPLLHCYTRGMVCRYSGPLCLALCISSTRRSPSRIRIHFLWVSSDITILDQMHNALSTTEA